MSKNKNNLTRREFLVNVCVAASLPVLNAPTMAIAESIATRSTNELIKKYPFGFNGEQIDFVTNNYHLGKGYRLYSPKIERFYQADLVSPFNKGGMNPFSYCHGNPTNFIDPTGFAVDGLGIGLGVGGIALNAIVIALILLAAPFTAGASLVGMVGAGAGLAACTSGIVASSLNITLSALPEDSAARKGLSIASNTFGILGGLLATVSLGAGAVGAFKAINSTKYILSTGKSIGAKLTSKTNGKVPFVRRAVGTALESSSTAAGISGLIAESSQDSKMKQDIALARIGLNALALFAYTPIGIYTRGLNTGNKMALVNDVLAISKESMRTSLNATHAVTTFISL